MEQEIQCMVCGRDQEEHETFLEISGNFICPECGGNTDEEIPREDEHINRILKEEGFNESEIENPLDY
jgi:hypothetical protein